MACEPGDVERPVAAVGRRAPQRRPLPPARPEEFGDAGEEIDDAEMNLKEPQRDVGRHRRPVPGGGDPQPAIERQDRAGRPDRQRDQKHTQGIVEPEDGQWRTVDRREEADERDPRRDRGRQTEGETGRGDERDEDERSDRRGGREGKEPAPLPRLVVHPLHIAIAEPAVRAEEGIDIHQPHRTAPGQEGAGDDPHDRQGKRIGGGEPKTVPGRAPGSEPPLLGAPPLPCRLAGEHRTPLPHRTRSGGRSRLRAPRPGEDVRRTRLRSAAPRRQSTVLAAHRFGSAEEAKA